MIQKPTLGRIVWFRQNADADEQAAIVTGTYEGEDNEYRVDLTVFVRQDYPDFETGIDYSEYGTEGSTWRWMPYQKAQFEKQPDPAA